MINLDFILSIIPQLLQGLLVSFMIAGGALCIGMIAGTLIGIGLTKGSRIVRLILNVYVHVIRGTPMLIQIVFLYYVLPLAGIVLSSLMTAIVAIGINSSAYISQIIKAGINTVGRDQAEAAYVLGFTHFQTMRFIILPQALLTILPALVNEGITLIKDSSLASVIGVVELYKESRIILSQSYDVFSVFCIVAVLYMLSTSALSALAYFLEKRWDVHHA